MKFRPSLGDDTVIRTLFFQSPSTVQKIKRSARISQEMKQFYDKCYGMKQEKETAIILNCHKHQKQGSGFNLMWKMSSVKSTGKSSYPVEKLLDYASGPNKRHHDCNN